jgi:biotin carboxyl carrier protein
MKSSPKKSAAKKKASPPRAPRRTRIEDIAPEEQIVGAPLLGKVLAYDAKTREITLDLEDSLTVGDGVRVKGRATDLIQRVERLRVGSRGVQSALAGETVHVEVADRVRTGDAVYKVRPA